MKQLVGLAGVLLATSASAGQPGPVAMPATTPEKFMAGHNGAAGLICETRARHRPAPELKVTITPPTVKIPDNAKRGTRLALPVSRRTLCHFDIVRLVRALGASNPFAILRTYL
jgi:hypothetical protein